MMDMTDVWTLYDREINETPMPTEYVDLFAAIHCRDCFKPSLCRFHVLGMKCVECGSYNTVRDKGPLVRQEGSASSSSMVIAHEMLELAIGDSTSDTESSTSPTLPSLTPLTSPEPMQDDPSPLSPSEDQTLLAGTLVENRFDLSGTITPPETPTRDEQMVSRTRLIRPSTSQMDTLTPEQSPMRENMGLVRGQSSIGEGVSRRISFSEDTGAGPAAEKWNKESKPDREFVLL
jgi:hypothetical protein